MDWPADKVERRKVSDLVPYARNSRTHSPEQVAQIAASIREWGWTMPILIDETGGIIAGHGRVMAAQKLGIEDVPCMTAIGWSEAKRRAYVIADNKLALNAGWDDEMLRVEFGELRDMGFDLELTGFSIDELQGFEMADEDLPGQGANEGSTASLADKFGIAPFSVLNAREGWWQSRKRAWLALGIKSELGRGENGYHAAPGGSPMVAG
jgi:ParB-like chromosome segregation protein Spo0J